MTQSMRSFVAAGAMLAGAAVLAQGCAQQQEAPQARQAEFRQSVATAPADLQLACAAEVAEVHDVAAERTLPISSSVGDDDTFAVLVSADGVQTICTIDPDGNVISLEQAEPAAAT